MKFYQITKKVIVYLAILSLYIHPVFSDDDEIFSLQEKVKIYRQILKNETDPLVIAEAHFKVAESLELLGRDTEATAEYLKLILNYPDSGDFARIAEKKLTILYDKFSKKEAEVVARDEIQEETKDPAIFFTYIKSLYETYRDQGKYDKSVQLLKKMMKMDPENEFYCVDLGNVYLNGYNDADTALKFFNKLVELNPNHPRVYTDIGLAYEKKGDIDNAIKYYQKSVELSPLNSWSIYGLSRMDALRLAKEKKLIKDWYFLGPFDDADRKGFEKTFGPEDKIELDKTYTGVSGESIRWSRPFTYTDSGFVDLNNMFKINDNVVAFCLTYAYSDKERTVQFRFGSDDPIKIWFNGELIFTKEVVLKPAEFDKDIIKVTFKKGWNEILIKAVEEYGSWGIYFRITDDEGNTPLDIVFDPLKDNVRAKAIMSKVMRQKGFRIAKATILYGTTIIVLFLGIYLLISNIHNKIKIRQMKEDFIASVSHELKTPLAAIKMFTETLKMGRVRDEVQVKDYYSTIIRETDRLTRFINKILDFQKIEKGKKIYSFEKVDLKALLHNAADIYNNQLQDENFVIEEAYASDIPEIELDEDAMLQVFLNLLINAYKYSTEEKYVKIKVEKSEKDIKVSITDKGMGISKDQITRIFDKFYRVDRDATKDIKGSGIGLAFVKSVIEAHGGRIAVQSQIGKGSTFIISLPLEREV